jgi:hypothetical protein
MLRQLGYGIQRPGKIGRARHPRRRVPHVFPPNGHNERYLRTTATRSGHYLWRPPGEESEAERAQRVPHTSAAIWGWPLCFVEIFYAASGPRAELCDGSTPSRLASHLREPISRILILKRFV